MSGRKRYDGFYWCRQCEKWVPKQAGMYFCPRCKQRIRTTRRSSLKGYEIENP